MGDCLIERTWPEGMKGMQNGTVERTISDEAIVADAAEKLSRETCCSRRGMEEMTNGTVIVSGKRSSI